jgi:hypothetical protein
MSDGGALSIIIYVSHVLAHSDELLPNRYRRHIRDNPYFVGSRLLKSYFSILRLFFDKPLEKVCKLVDRRQVTFLMWRQREKT